MKLKILPPTLREKKRYVGLKMYSEENLKKEEIFNILWNSIINNYGEIESSKINLWIVDTKEVENKKRKQYNIIVKCQRGYEDKLKTAFYSIYRYRQSRLVVHTLGTSGTIKTLQKKYNLLQ